MTFRAGQSGNPNGRRKGSKNASTLLREKLTNDLDDIIQSVITAAKEGSAIHQRMILERVIPALKPVDEAVKLRLSASLTERAQTVVRAVGSGKLTPDQAGRFMALLVDEARILETDQLVDRIDALERQMARTINENA